jgi:hypothetical protein
MQIINRGKGEREKGQGEGGKSRWSGEINEK